MKNCDEGHDGVTANARVFTSRDQLSMITGRLRARVRYTHCARPLHTYGNQQADESAEIPLLGSGAQGRDDAMQQALRHSIRILFLDPPLRR